MKKSDLTISIVIPAYNEADNIKEAIEMMSNTLPSMVSNYEIIIIDDGSSDGTGDYVRELVNNNEKIKVICNEKNYGKGASLISGFKHARMDWVLFTDADLQIHISELVSFLPYTSEFDIIAGFRTGRRDPLSRRFFSKIYTAIIRFFLGIRVKDINCPFKLIKTPLLQNIELHTAGFFIDTELIYNALLREYRIKELPVACQPRQKGISTVRFRHVIETIKELQATIRRHSMTDRT